MPVINFDDSEEWRVRFNELQTRWRRDQDNYETELGRKDQIILDLREKLNHLLSQPIQTPQQMTGMISFQEPQRQNYPDDRDDLIHKLRSTIGDKDTEIMTLMSELRKRHTIEQVVAEQPKIIRVTEPNIKEIRYEKDPYLIEQNARLSRELEYALVDYL